MTSEKQHGSSRRQAAKIMILARALYGGNWERQLSARLLRRFDVPAVMDLSSVRASFEVESMISELERATGVTRESVEDLIRRPSPKKGARRKHS